MSRICRSIRGGAVSANVRLWRNPPATFAGTLRGYQREGLGWLVFLQQFGFGGCLADDMGLGKTVMVLALLAMRREAQTETGRKTQPVRARFVIQVFVHGRLLPG